MFKKTKQKSPSSLQLYIRTKKPNALLVISILWCLTFSYSLVCISAQMREPGYSSPTVTLQSALRTRLWKPYRKVPSKGKKKHHLAKIMPFGRFTLLWMKTTSTCCHLQLWLGQQTRRAFPKAKVGITCSRESNRKPKCRQSWKERSICSAQSWAFQEHGNPQSWSKNDLL